MKKISAEQENWTYLSPFRTAVLFKGQTIQITSDLSPKRDCGSKRVNRQDEDFCLLFVCVFNRAGYIYNTPVLCFATSTNSFGNSWTWSRCTCRQHELQRWSPLKQKQQQHLPKEEKPRGYPLFPSIIAVEVSLCILPLQNSCPPSLKLWREKEPWIWTQHVRVSHQVLEQPAGVNVVTSLRNKCS